MPSRSAFLSNGWTPAGISVASNRRSAPSNRSTSALVIRYCRSFLIMAASLSRWWRFPFSRRCPSRSEKTPERDRDSNPGTLRCVVGFQNRCINPLCHLSELFIVADGIRTHNYRTHNPVFYQLKYCHHQFTKEALSFAPKASSAQHTNLQENSTSAF